MGYRFQDGIEMVEAIDAHWKRAALWVWRILGAS